ncbi:hypothetical protein LTR53_015827 [Teratosphaeriaceae sp. CCFEE 6253]|nr:hypothetical protein LTR53_015827 [Teratosphaeriaceae sp. CCFEE 6253]
MSSNTQPHDLGIDLASALSRITVDAFLAALGGPAVAASSATAFKPKQNFRIFLTAEDGAL